MKAAFDIAVVGSGFGGSLMAMMARRLGHRVILLERGRHPRFAIGESSTPLANLLLEELASRHGLTRLSSLSRWGSWRRHHPRIGCGLKRGFSFFHHQFGKPFRVSEARSEQLLVAASPCDELADTHWYRPDFDEFLVREARACGVEYWDEAEVERFERGGGGVWLHGRRRGGEFSIRARFVIDATGPRGLLHRELQLAEVSYADLPRTEALFSHFNGVGKLEDTGVSGGEIPPYPVDAAAVHHVFEGGWIWVLNFENGVTSAGVAATETLARELGLEEGGPAWERLLDRLPTVRSQFERAAAILPFRHLPRLSFRSATVTGDRWALLPSAAGFVDPLLSTGFPLTLLGVSRLVEILEQDWGTSRFGERLGRYGELTGQELAATGRLIGAMYRHLGDPEVFHALARVYFAAASFSESSWRLGRLGLWQPFLLQDHPEFGPASRECLEQALRLPANGGRSPERAALLRRIDEGIRSVDVAGLGDEHRRNWHPVRFEDLIGGAEKLGVERGRVEALARALGFGDAGRDTVRGVRAR
ncbi:MAG TPA: FAD-dependent oxidoreductase [Methylomirabilota bacterium]|nr:FAD-dependent oxidoreductase [Methylomirabilota bacterium]